jgi:hypothetical protein
MTLKTLTPLFVLPIVPAVALALTLTTGATSVSAAGRAGRFTATKDCTPFAAGANFCTLVNFSDPKLARLLDGKNLYYEQSAFALADGSMLLDSNVALDAGSGDKARGRCTFDFTNGMGLCTIEDGFGTLTRLHARIDVDCTAGLVCSVKGTYSFGEDD